MELMEMDKDRKQTPQRSTPIARQADDFDFDVWAMQVRQKMIACLKKRSAEQDF
ncbi:MAG: hypothetical protein VKK04_07165 [Synechococcales bacterium]|nr:hypothetical protein [Synechococcales bacterium]